jgi:sucrose-phosphate synthase
LQTLAHSGMCVSLIRMRIHLYSIHGLFRGKNLEIGKDSDNGGQIIYVMELAKELSQRPEVEHVHFRTH